jgi:uncharacterized coiled-coil DUF342 family protein
MKVVEKSKPAIERMDVISNKVKELKKKMNPKYEILRELKDQIKELDDRIESSKKERDSNRTVNQISNMLAC